MPSVPLEDVAGWRLSYPHLNKLVDRGMQLNNCDLILLNTSFRLMQDFPPRHSKLGIGLELKFPDSMLWWDSNEDADYKKWACTTYMYREGVLISESTREECQVSEQWKVRPFFQSKWWASTFTSLTEARKVAEDSKDAEAIENANTHSRCFFQDLSVMQEISAVRVHSHWNPMQEKKQRTRLAILLWKFSQAPGDSAGTTTWQNLIAPPDRVTTNSPPPPETDMDLPPLSMDSILSPGVVSFHNNHFLSPHNMQYNVFPDGMDEELRQDGFMGLKPEQIHDFSHLQSSFNLASSHEYSGVDPSLHDTFDLPLINVAPTAGIDSMVDDHMFQAPDTQMSTRSTINEQIFEDDHSNDNHSETRPLSRFDVTTHQVLQQQLQVEDTIREGCVSHSPQIKTEPSPELYSVPDQIRGIQQAQIERIHDMQQQHRDAHVSPFQPWSPPIDEHEEALRNALLAASAMSDLGTPRHPPQTPRPRHLFDDRQRHEDPHWISPMPFRPSLQSYHSFPSMRTDDHFHRPAFGGEHHIDGMSLSQPLPHLDVPGFIDQQLSAVSAPEDFLHASSEGNDHDESVRGYARAHSEPDLSLASEVDLSYGAHHAGMGTMADTIDVTLQAHSLTPDNPHLGGSFVEVSMEDVQG